MGNYYNYYETEKFTSAERVQLAEDIILPTLPKEPLTHSYLKYQGEYRLAFNEYHDVEGKFYLPIMTPLVDKSSAVNTRRSAPSTKTHKGSTLNTSSYNTSNYITLTIPKYIVLNFTDRIPAGTEFIVVSIGDSLNIKDMRIIGIYTK